MAWNRIGTWSVGRNYDSGLRRRVGEHSPSNRRPATSMGSRYTQLEISNDKDQDTIKLFHALTVIKRISMEEIKPLLLKEKEIQKSMLRSKEQELITEKHEKSQLLKRVENMDKELNLHQTQLHEKEKELQEHERGRHWQVEYENLEKRYNDLQRNCNQHQKMIADKIKIENEHEMLKNILCSKEQELLKEKHDKSQLLERVEKMDKETKSLKAHLQEKEKQLEERREATNKACANKNDALTRLNHMGHHLSEGNPNNTDLSDPNRPSKLGERYSELYDNEWTNVFEGLTYKFEMDDRGAIDILRNILLVYGFFSNARFHSPKYNTIIK